MKSRVPYQLTSKERKAMNDEINRQIAESHSKYLTEVDAMVLYTLHTELGFGKERLRRFWEALSINHKELIKRYEMPDDFPWLCSYFLKQNLGIDIEEWDKEVFGEENVTKL